MLEGTCHCGDVSWTHDGAPAAVTACSCTICRRYGALWAYGHLNDDVRVSGRTTAYRRADSGDIDFHFCPTCGCLSHYIATAAKQDGRVVTAVNVRMSEPGSVEGLPVNHFDGLETWHALPSNGRTVRDLWF